MRPAAAGARNALFTPLKKKIHPSHQIFRHMHGTLNVDKK